MIMKLKFKNQKFQSDAAKAVTDVFLGQPNNEMQEYTHDTGVDTSGQSDMDFGSVGFRNHPIMLSNEQLLENIRNIQIAAMLKPVEHVVSGNLRLTIEMETGTGKTYTYIKTMLELNKLYGWSKFIIVVPSIAIREGVCKSFEVMSEHFAREYGKRIQSFVYDSKQLTKIDQFASDNNLHVMIINTQAFNARGEDARRIDMKLDSFRSRKPKDVIAATRPIVIIDEPQSVLGDKKKANATREKLKDFNPLFTLLYSATHREVENMVYRLDAMDAYNQKLVKKITVKGTEQKGTTATNGYLQLMSIELSEGKNPRARIGFDKKTANGLKPTIQYVEDGQDIYALSGELEEYKDHWRVEEIDGYARKIRLLNGLELYEGDRVGAVNEDLLRRTQIYETIKSHIEKERRLFRMGIKCLSLFFIDHVDNYRIYGEKGETSLGKYGVMFEEEYANYIGSLQLETGDEEYAEYLQRFDAKDVHNGYFSKDKNGHFVQSKVERGSEYSNDVSAYDLIMKDKERLLNLKEPTRFIFSHSALKEGWDNPNVFQICTLKDSDSTIKKRQEVGRGMRLCVNQDGERQDENVLHGRVFEINELTIIASESYDSFAKGLQTEIADAVSDRPQRVEEQLFRDLVIVDAEGNKHKIDRDDAGDIVFQLRMRGYTDKKGQLTRLYFDDKMQGKLDFGEEYNAYKESIVMVLEQVFDPESVKPEDARSVREAKFNQQRFERKEFQDLWKRINHQTYYTVDFDTDQLVKNAIVKLDAELHVSSINIQVKQGTMNEIKSKQDLESGDAMVVKESSVHIRGVNEEVGFNTKYDLVGKLVENTGLTRKAVVQILKNISPKTFALYQVNPEEFIIRTSNIINECKAIAVIEHITYHKLEKQYDTDIFSQATIKGKLGVNALESTKSLYDLVVVDSAGIEMNFATELEQHSEVAVYTKLPNGFYINTPVGHYNPDWAVVFKEGADIKHIYFVAETKGTLNGEDRRGLENAKIECARRHFVSIAQSDVTYGVVTNYQDLRDIIVK